MNTIEVCFTPQLFALFPHTGHIVVVIDVLRATSSMCVALHHGAQHIVPVAGINEALAYKSQGYLIGGERNGEMQEGFDFGNSPFSFMQDKIKGAKIAISTTNGTQALVAAAKAHKTVVGSFLNLDALCDFLIKENKPIVCLCAGWKNRFNLEDTILAGAIVEKLQDHFRFTVDCDSAMAAKQLYNLAKGDLNKYLENSSHRKRLKKLHIEKDIEYCLQPNLCPVVPIMENGILVAHQSINAEVVPA